MPMPRMLGLILGAFGVSCISLGTISLILSSRGLEFAIVGIISIIVGFGFLTVAKAMVDTISRTSIEKVVHNFDPIVIKLRDLEKQLQDTRNQSHDIEYEISQMKRRMTYIIQDNNQDDLQTPLYLKQRLEEQMRNRGSELQRIATVKELKDQLMEQSDRQLSEHRRIANVEALKRSQKNR